jgi:integrase
LSQAALDLVGESHNPDQLVFRGTSGRMSGWSKMLARLHQQSGTTGWALHDLRRSAATRMQDLGTPQETVSRILNHAVGGVDSVYLRGHLEEKKRLALEAWSAELTRLTSMDEESCKALNETCAEILEAPQRSSR